MVKPLLRPGAIEQLTTRDSRAYTQSAFRGRVVDPIAPSNNGTGALNGNRDVGAASDDPGPSVLDRQLQQGLDDLLSAPNGNGAPIPPPRASRASSTESEDSDEGNEVSAQRPQHRNLVQITAPRGSHLSRPMTSSMELDFNRPFQRPQQQGDSVATEASRQVHPSASKKSSSHFNFNSPPILNPPHNPNCAQVRLPAAQDLTNFSFSRRTLSSAPQQALPAFVFNSNPLPNAPRLFASASLQPPAQDGSAHDKGYHGMNRRKVSNSPVVDHIMTDVGDVEAAAPCPTAMILPPQQPESSDISMTDAPESSVSPGVASSPTDISMRSPSDAESAWNEAGDMTGITYVSAVVDDTTFNFVGRASSPVDTDMTLWEQEIPTRLHTPKAVAYEHNAVKRIPPRISPQNVNHRGPQYPHNRGFRHPYGMGAHNLVNYPRWQEPRRRLDRNLRTDNDQRALGRRALHKPDVVQEDHAQQDRVALLTQDTPTQDADVAREDERSPKRQRLAVVDSDHLDQENEVPAIAKFSIFSHVSQGASLFSTGFRGFCADPVGSLQAVPPTVAAGVRNAPLAIVLAVLLFPAVAVAYLVTGGECIMGVHEPRKRKRDE